MRRHLSYANVMATVAVVLAAAGGGTAIAISASKNSVTSGSLRPGNVTASDLAGVRVVRVETIVGTVEGSVTASCRPGERVLGGGAVAAGTSAVVTGSSLEGSGWTARGRTTAGTSPLRAEVLCLRKKSSKPVTGP